MDEIELQEGILKGLRILYETACINQTKPDGNNCAICLDNDHQAFECRFNAFNRIKEIR